MSWLVSPRWCKRHSQVNGKLIDRRLQPNLIPPITTVTAALEYRSKLQELEPNVNFLMSLYLDDSISPLVVKEAKAAGIAGVKLYASGSTTNAARAVYDFEPFYPTFAAMEEEGIILNLHGEAPSGDSVTVMNAEESFLPHLLEIHQRFPKLKIVLEHCTTAAAVEAVKSCGATVAATITPHHMLLTIDDVVGDPVNYCKPVAKSPSDRFALIHAVVSGNPKFFLGTDSAPHPINAKRTDRTVAGARCAAGVFTQPYATQLVLTALEEVFEKDGMVPAVTLESLLGGFLSEYGRRFYGIQLSKEKIRIQARKQKVVERFEFETEATTIVPFWRGASIPTLEWL